MLHMLPKVLWPVRQVLRSLRRVCRVPTFADSIESRSEPAEGHGTFPQGSAKAVEAIFRGISNQYHN